MKTVVIINGHPRSGKDTFIDLTKSVGKYISVSGVKIWKTSLIDPIKKAAELLGWTYEKDDRARKFLSDLKVLADKTYGFSEDFTKSWAKDFVEYDASGILFMQAREPKDIDMIKSVAKEFGLNAVTLFISRKDAIRDEYACDADAGVEEYSYDYTISNDGTLDDLRDEAFAFLQALERAEDVESGGDQ